MLIGMNDIAVVTEIKSEILATSPLLSAQDKSKMALTSLIKHLTFA